MARKHGCIRRFQDPALARSLPRFARRREQAQGTSFRPPYIVAQVTKTLCSASIIITVNTFKPIAHGPRKTEIPVSMSGVSKTSHVDTVALAPFPNRTY
jgi:hypothetical protein